MSNLVPVSWRESLDDVRSRVLSVFDRWRPRRAKQESDREKFFWPTALLAAGGPAVDVSDDDDEVVVTAELPGLDEKDFSVELEGQRLLLHGEKKAAREEKQRSYFYTETSYGSFYRSIPLPCEVDSTKVDASYKRGVLRVRLPKTAEARQRRVHIQVD